MNGLESAGLTDIGKKRTTNQDSLLVNDSTRLYVVADGIGGRSAGDIASQMTVQIMDEVFSLQDPLPKDETRNDTLSEEAQRLLRSVERANQEVFTAACSDDALTGMGTTVSAVCLAENPSVGKTLIGANIGDSPIYLIRHDNIEELSVPHTIIVEVPSSNSTGNAVPVTRQMLTRAVGIHESVEAEIFEIQCYEGDIVVISSDGLSNKVASEEIRSIVSNASPNEACHSLVDLANQRGGEDNITVVVVKVASTQRRLSWFLNRISQFFHPQKQEA